MERNPGDYVSWEEEQMRDALLVVLNTHYRGAAVGEAFNAEAKTDILVTVDNEHVFVGECKWWSGPADFAATNRTPPSALDQLLNYLTWRETETALVGWDDGSTLAQAQEAGLMRCRVARPTREADLAVCFAHLPKPKTPRRPAKNASVGKPAGGPARTHP
jgi:hypothetical protein